MITATVDGNQYTDFISIELGMGLPAIARDFNLTIAQPANTPLPFKGGESIDIFVDGELRLSGSIFTVSPSYTKTSHTISMSGRSNVADLVDSTLLPLSFAADTSLQSVIERVIAQLSLDLKVINEVPGLADFTRTEDKISAEPGTNAFSFIDRLARKRQVLLTSDASGNIIITRNGTEQNPVTLLNRANGTQGNIKSSSVSYNLNNRFGNYIVMSQKNAVADSFGGALDPASFVNQRGEQIDTSIRSTRQFVMQAEKASTSAEAASRATWQANISRTRSRNYSVIVQGVRPKGGDIWEPNKLQQVNDEQAGIDEIMLIDSVRFIQSKSGGTLTQLSFVDKDAYTVALSEPAPSVKQDNQYAEFS
jgi:prophage tail gpP-like protein